jgi:hypothetical protein
MVIADQGNVGIGITNPGTNLDLAGTFRNSLATTHSLLGGSGNKVVMTDNNGTLYTSSTSGDADTVDGVHASAIVYGGDGRASFSNSNMNDVNQKSGFYFYEQPTGTPIADWVNWITIAGNNWQSSNNYEFQLAHAFHSDNLYVRGMANGGARPWREVITSGNIGSQTVSNVTSLAGTWWGTNYFGSNKGGGSYVGGQNTYGLEAYSTDGGAAGMSFHRGGYYAVNMGLDPDNVLRIGGWSAAANIWQLDMGGSETIAGNFVAGGYIRNAGATTHSLLGGAGNTVVMADNTGTLYNTPISTFMSTNLVGQTFSNIKKNAGFESGDLNGWAGGSITSAYAHSGSYSLRMNAGTSYCNEYAYEDFDARTNTVYSLSAWIKTISETAYSGVFVSEGVGPGCSQWNRMVVAGIGGTTDWTQKYI